MKSWLFVRGFGFERERMQAVGQFRGERPMYEAVTLQSRSPGESRGGDANAKMRLAGGRCGRMARMVGRFVYDLHIVGRKRAPKLCFDSVLHAHGEFTLSYALRRLLGLPLRRVAPNLLAMNLNSPIFDRIRVKSEPAPEVEQPRCDHPGCASPGQHRAPMGRLREGQYFCFCLEHVRAYNQSYNYFSGMSDKDVARFQRDAETGHRPTWTMGVNRAAKDHMSGADDEAASSSFDPVGFAFRRPARPEPAKPRYGLAAMKALGVLGLDDTVDAEGVKSRYKELVKRLHPDANGGDRSSEDRLREIIHAYKYLRSAKLV
jgi:DnaJ domain